MKTKSSVNRFKALWEKYRVWTGLLVILLFSWAIFLYIYKGAIVPAAQTPVTKPAIQVSDEDLCYFETDSGPLEIHQAFFSSVSEMMGVRLKLKVKPETEQIQDITAHVTLLDGISKEIIYEDDVSVRIDGGGYLSIMLDEPQMDIQDKYYEIAVVFDGDSADDIRVVGTTSTQYSTWGSALNSGAAPGALGIEQCIEYGTFILFLYKLFVLLFSCFIIIFYILVLIKKQKIETVYLFTVLALGVFYCFIIIPFGVPDESMHASTVYRISNEVMGVPDTGNEGTIYKRTDDAAVELNNDCNLYQYYVVYHQLFSTVENDALYECGYRDTGVSWVLYAPAVVGVLAGRLLGLGSVPMYMLARLLTLLVFAFMTWWAMKKLPFGKTALFIICILPMTLQQAASVSYDAMVNAVTILFTATCFAMAFSADRLRKQDMVLSAVLGVLLIFAKSGAYLPLIILFTMIPAVKFGSAKKKWLEISCFCAVLLAVFLVKSIGLVAGESTSGALNGTASDGYSLGYILQHPGTIFNVGIGTLLLNTGYYISTMIGQKLGFLNIILDDVVVYGYLCILALSVLTLAEDQYIISVKQKWLMIVGICCSTALVLLSMWLFITPRASGVIMGVQGRYFIPLLWPLLMVFKNKLIVLRKKIDSGLLTGAVILHILVFAYVFRGVFLG